LWSQRHKTGNFIKLKQTESIPHQKYLIKEQYFVLYIIVILTHW